MNYFQAEREHKQTQMERFLQQNITNSGHTGKNYIDFIPTKDAEWTIQNVHSIFEQITKELLSPQFGSSASVTALFFKLFHLLDQPEYYQTIPVKIGTDAENRLFTGNHFADGKTRMAGFHVMNWKSDSTIPVTISIRL